MSKPQPNLAQIAQSVFDDVFSNIIHDTIIWQHREHKMLLPTLDLTTKLPHCDKCNLPRLLDPPLAPKVRGATGEPPKDTVYCDRKPWCRTPGFDIYGNPFPRADVTGRPPTKKEREAAKNSKKDAGGTDTPASNEDGTAPPSPSADGDNGDNRKLEKGEKKASKIDEKLKKGEYVPWQTCPSCKRSLLVTRFAKHLEQCMGLSGRAASRNAMAKMGANGTPAGSRGGTPGPGSQDAGGENDAEGEEDELEKIKGPGAVRKKVLKKGIKEKMKKEKEKGGGDTKSGANGKAKSTSGGGGGAAVKRPPSTAASAGNGEGKRDRDSMLDGGGDEDEDGEIVHVKKRQKLQRAGSQASLGSQSTAPPNSGLEAVDMERSGSLDGSLIDFGEDAE